jgi:hypothetical protein
MKLVYFQVNYYRGFDAAGFPVGLPIESHTFNAPFTSVAQDDVPGISLNKAATFARNLGYLGRFGIEEINQSAEKMATDSIYVG